MIPLFILKTIRRFLNINDYYPTPLSQINVNGKTLERHNCELVEVFQ
jgi:hypothetical protein